MKATGVVRRIDSLGRIVIPKEIRRTLKINEGDCLEIFVDNREVILKKYSFLDDMVETSNKLVDSFYRLVKKTLLITDKDRVVACSKDVVDYYLDKEITKEIKGALEDRVEKVFTDSLIVTDSGLTDSFYLVPIIVNSDSVGGVILIDSEISDIDRAFVQFIAALLTKNIEE